MEKSWIQMGNRFHPLYEKGVKDFLQFAYSSKQTNEKIGCPCIKCNNFLDQTRDVVEDHLIIYGMTKSYTRWIYHGESFEDKATYDNVDVEFDNDIPRLVDDIGIAKYGKNWTKDAQDDEVGFEMEDLDRLNKLMSDAQTKLYPGCQYSKLTFIINLLHLKTLNSWSCKAFDMTLQVWKNSLPIGTEIPNSYYAKKIIRALGFRYEKIHACVNDCILFYNEFKDLDACPNTKCKAPRYKPGVRKVPQKVLRYFPLKPRLQRLFVNKEVAFDMTWHKTSHIVNDKIMRHPADSEAWKHFDEKHSFFANDPRNVRLGLATDGFNPFGRMRSQYSIWPVILVPYNLPPWRCMKDPFFLLSMLIPGPRSPGKDIDIYLQPLIDELKDLWQYGVATYDSYKKEYFNLYAALLWTINDLSAYGMLLGWSNKGYHACPICMYETGDNKMLSLNYFSDKFTLLSDKLCSSLMLHFVVVDCTELKYLLDSID